jgi:hypothetical protein
MAQQLAFISILHHQKLLNPWRMIVLGQKWRNLFSTTGKDGNKTLIIYLGKLSYFTNLNSSAIWG